ncbi:MAG TPA: 30S ribosomal protein S20 [bacterium]|nr:30S ribosomal protein S20 [bacterium]HPN30593.1 30S ribosomal protein S20 [bacterium]
MANIKSAKKKARQAEKHRIANSQKKTKLRTIVKKVRAAAEGGKKEEASKMLKESYSVIDKSVNKNLIHKNKANRLKSKIASKISKLK